MAQFTFTMALYNSLWFRHFKKVKMHILSFEHMTECIQEGA